MNDNYDSAEPEDMNPGLVDLSNAYALVIKDDNQVQIVTPILPDDAPLTDGHLLMLGLVMLLRQPGWATQVVEQTAKVLEEAKNASISDTQTEG